jgi:hypothetical protein
MVASGEEYEPRLVVIEEDTIMFIWAVRAIEWSIIPIKHPTLAQSIAPLLVSVVC